MMDLQGQFLIAMPQLEDYFQNTVVYMCEHNEQGSMGLVINQPTDLSIAELYSKMNFMMKNDRTFSNELVLAGGQYILSVVLFCIRKLRKNLSIVIKLLMRCISPRRQILWKPLVQRMHLKNIWLHSVVPVGQQGSLNKRLQIMRG